MKKKQANKIRDGLIDVQSQIHNEYEEITRAITDLFFYNEDQEDQEEFIKETNKNIESIEFRLKHQITKLQNIRTDLKEGQAVKINLTPTKKITGFPTTDLKYGEVKPTIPPEAIHSFELPEPTIITKVKLIGDDRQLTPDIELVYETKGIPDRLSGDLISFKPHINTKEALHVAMIQDKDLVKVKISGRYSLVEGFIKEKSTYKRDKNGKWKHRSGSKIKGLLKTIKQGEQNENTIQT